MDKVIPTNNTLIISYNPEISKRESGFIELPPKSEIQRPIKGLLYNDKDLIIKNYIGDTIIIPRCSEVVFRKGHGEHYKDDLYFVPLECVLTINGIAVNQILVNVGSAYEYDSKGFLNENTLNDVKHTVRYGIVESIPAMMFGKLAVKDRDTIYFHHNVVRRSVDVNGHELWGNFRYDDQGRFMCPLDLVFAYKRDGNVTALDPFVFVEPISQEILQTKENGFITINDNEIPQYARIVYPNKELLEKGYKSGDIVLCSQDFEYEYFIDGKRLYKTNTIDILGKFS